MAFTALHPEAGRLDASQPDLGGGLAWSDIHRARPRPGLTCPECGWGVHAKHTPRPRRLRIFAHDAGRPPECTMAEESWEHHMLKLEMAAAIRAAGWHAELEVPAQDRTWRADVMATSPDGARRMAWEAQLSPITVDDIRTRTDRYRAHGIDVCWVSPHARTPVWMGEVPSIRVRPPLGPDPWTVDDGLAGFNAAGGRWEFREEPLPHFVAWVLRGSVITRRTLPAYRRVSRTVEDEYQTYVRDLWWTSRKSAQAQVEHEQMRLQREAEAQAREAERQKRAAEAARKREERAADNRRRRAEVVERGRRAREGQAERARVLRQEAARLRRAAEEQQRARDEAEHARRAELGRNAEGIAAAWWARLSPAQVEELFAAVIEEAEEDGVPLSNPRARAGVPAFAYGVPMHGGGLYGIVRPCPALAVLSPQLAFQRIFVRNAEEAQELIGAGLPPWRIRDLELPNPR
ncbi:competence protein CoiA family protein [Streptomyces sp. NBC_00539]|uniref:competence protein CoiA family protein n=1 Tax=Streptomyces sp. NBC_00539 TaxID=2975770 RepID=UPI002E80E49D|nr:competence protein CoiA family protein [Streptomyces sp. NBC_00539]WUC63019.1 competence protein CoiA family protein [Streptomyces sp. NBC_00539]